VQSLSKKKVKQVACGDYNTLCLTEDGLVYQFGGSLFKDKKDKRPSSSQNPMPVQALYGKSIIQIDCGDFHSAALESSGDLYTWGGGSSAYNKGQCGHGHTNAIETPEKIKLLSHKRVVKVACGGFHTLILTSENEVFAFGAGNYGECGYGDFLDTAKPKLVRFGSSGGQNETSNFGGTDKFMDLGG
jgi:E3 ubiquitin-protein ligase HERC2